MEQRAIFRHGLEIREEGDENKRTICGYPIVFEELTDRVGYYKEKVDRHALDDVDLSDVCLIVGHDFNNLLARNGKNMSLEIDDEGLFFRAELGDTEYDKLIYDRVKRGLLEGMSFGFTVDEMDTDYKSQTDTIKRIGKLYEITLTPVPAYPQTVATAVERNKAHDEELRKTQEAEEIEKLAKELEEM